MSRMRFIDAINEAIESGMAEYYMFCDVDGSRRLGRVVRVNTKTAVLKIMHGAKSSFTIKRHKTKHHLKLKFKPFGVRRVGL